ncbi:hypothetical protein Cgig2_016537 [Carnegiea gigantea]|uniref:Uncharacterized protein n=1 Tax=Carnegiea gigantea TaxID=171969 RepID=A0A9Q1JZD6_9CARY|nr:hypothetical protein Cgig2_016537 [Carnegiea gigantea]
MAIYLHVTSQLTLAATEAEFEERILQHLAAAVAMRGGPSYFLRGGQRDGSSSQADLPFFILTAPGASHGTAVGGRSESVVITTRSPSVRQPNSPGARELPVSYSPVRPDQSPFNRAGSNVSLASRLGFLSESRYTHFHETMTSFLILVIIFPLFLGRAVICDFCFSFGSLLSTI